MIEFLDRCKAWVWERFGEDTPIIGVALIIAVIVAVKYLF